MNKIHSICRLCLSNGKDLISPCNCNDSIKHMHIDCLKFWMNSCDKNQYYCPFCKSKYNIDIYCVNKLKTSAFHFLFTILCIALFQFLFLSNRYIFNSNYYQIIVFLIVMYKLLCLLFSDYINEKIILSDNYKSYLIDKKLFYTFHYYGYYLGNQNYEIKNDSCNINLIDTSSWKRLFASIFSAILKITISFAIVLIISAIRGCYALIDEIIFGK